ncbi:MAG TPA: Holliday junction branch migration protein RuvA [Acidobacteriota bacterium]|nr:Holliday junction branch migration protein RuvA [Acidobacteriota bacterium]
MIARLKGTIAEKHADRVILDVRGVGYDVHIPVSTYYELGEEEQAVELRIYTHVTDSAITLYGFRTADEKKLFTMLIQISGIGPRLGVAILSGLPPEEFAQAVRGGDLRRITSIPGIGKKTAERLLLEMRDKMAAWQSSEDSPPALASGTAADDVVSALVNLGYSRSEAEKRVGKANKDTEAEEFEVLLRAALRG